MCCKGARTGFGDCCFMQKPTATLPKLRRQAGFFPVADKPELPKLVDSTSPLLKYLGR